MENLNKIRFKSITQLTDQQALQLLVEFQRKNIKIPDNQNQDNFRNLEKERGSVLIPLPENNMIPQNNLQNVSIQNPFSNIINNNPLSYPNSNIASMISPINKTQPSVKVIQNADRTNQDSFISPYIKQNDSTKIKQQYAVLWYEKLALQISVQRLIQQNIKKDELILQLRNELKQQKSKMK